MDVSSGGLTGTPATLPENWAVVSGYLVGPNADLQSASLSGADLSNADLDGADLRNATLTNANLSGAFLDQGRLGGAALGLADLSGAQLFRITSGGITGVPASLPADWQVVSGYLMGPGAVVADAFLPGLSLPGADLAGISFNGSNLAGADFANASLSGADLGNATLTNADLTGTKLFDASLNFANLTGAKLPGDLMSDVSVIATNFTNADLAGADLAAADFVDEDPPADTATLAGADLESANLTGAKLDNVNASNADFTRANLSNAEMFQASIGGANLAGTKLTGVTSPVGGTPKALPVKWHLVPTTGEPGFAYLAGPGAGLFSAMLDGANLHGLDLAGARLNQAELAGANLSEANLSSAELIDANFVDRNGVKRADLSDVNLAHADLDGSNLSPQDARLPGVRWLDTTCPNGISSNEYTGGCFSKPLHNPLVVTVNGVKPNGEYVLGGFKITCHTTDALEPVTVPAKLKVTKSGPNGIGKTTATCQGAVDAAGDKSKPVSVSYDVLYGFGGFKTPKGRHRHRPVSAPVHSDLRAG